MTRGKLLRVAWEDVQPVLWGQTFHLWEGQPTPRKLAKSPLAPSPRTRVAALVEGGALVSVGVKLEHVETHRGAVPTKTQSLEFGLAIAGHGTQEISPVSPSLARRL